MFDKIAELFYPRELKEMIAELRAQDDLNEAALIYLNKIIIICLFISIFVFFFLVFFESFIFAVILTCLVIFLSVREIGFHVSVFKTMVYGTVVKCRIDEIKIIEFIRFFPHCKIHCSYEDKDLVIKKVPMEIVNSNELQKDHEISVWWSELDGCEPVLNIPEVMQTHCLRKYPAEKI